MLFGMAFLEHRNPVVLVMACASHDVDGRLKGFGLGKGQALIDQVSYNPG